MLTHQIATRSRTRSGRYMLFNDQLGLQRIKLVPAYCHDKYTRLHNPLLLRIHHAQSVASDSEFHVRRFIRQKKVNALETRQTADWARCATLHIGKIKLHHFVARA